MKTTQAISARLGFAAAAGMLALGLSSCTATPGTPQLSPSPGLGAGTVPSTTPAAPTSASLQPVPAPSTQGRALAGFASAAAAGSSAPSGGTFDANGAGLDFNIDCRGAGTITVNVTAASGEAAAGVTSFDAPCEAGKLTSLGNRDYTRMAPRLCRCWPPRGWPGP